jgi:hypothetical protein
MIRLTEKVNRVIEGTFDEMPAQNFSQKENIMPHNWLIDTKPSPRVMRAPLMPVKQEDSNREAQN